MAIIPQTRLFSWEEVDAASDLDRLLLVLSALPDEPLMRRLEQRRGRGRDDYPIRPTWNAVIAGIVYDHPSAASLLRELRRNGELRQVCGFDPGRGAAGVPSDDAFGHFLELLIDSQDHLMALFDSLLRELGHHLPDLGKHVAIDAKALSSFGNPKPKKTGAGAGTTACPGGPGEKVGRRRDHDADWGTKTYRGIRKDGSPWKKVTKWFGYGLHLLVDRHCELPLAFRVTKASVSDITQCLPLLNDLKARQPRIGERCADATADRGYDSGPLNRTLYEDFGISPIIDNRKLWKGEPTRPLFPDRVDSFIYDEKGHVSCICPATGEQRPLAFCGFERDRRTLKYRCPAAACGLTCAGRSRCEGRAKVGTYGRGVRVPLDLDRRIFTPIARSSYKWTQLYKERTAVERVNSRVDAVLGFERHFIKGIAKMTTRVTLAMVVLLAMALGRIRAEQPELMRSMTAPVRRAA